jgi:hypothetical protein
MKSKLLLTLILLSAPVYSQEVKIEPTQKVVIYTNEKQAQKEINKEIVNGWTVKMIHCSINGGIAVGGRFDAFNREDDKTYETKQLIIIFVLEKN